MLFVVSLNPNVALRNKNFLVLSVTITIILGILSFGRQHSLDEGCSGLEGVLTDHNFSLLRRANESGGEAVNEQKVVVLVDGGEHRWTLRTDYLEPIFVNKHHSCVA